MRDTAALPGFDPFPFAHEGRERTVFARGRGPGIVVIHEIPGITPEVRRFAERVAERGFRVYLPSLFGAPDRPMSGAYAARQILRACISREFHVLAGRRSSPVTDWLRALCRVAHAQCGGPGVGAIGMCLTGNFALALMVDDAVMAPVLSQPSLPFALTPGLRRGLHLSGADLRIVKARAAAGCGVLGLRFTGDAMCPGARFERLREELGDGFEAVEIDSGRGSPHGIGRLAHSVLTLDLVDREGHPTRAALDRVLAFLEERLLPADHGETKESKNTSTPHTISGPNTHC